MCYWQMLCEWRIADRRWRASNPHENKEGHLDLWDRCHDAGVNLHKTAAKAKRVNIWVRILSAHLERLLHTPLR
ncbi:MAG: hypothetical protein M1826_006513 [Phylliscum demangeonii]|nr:MAG: hypothetical protein M1826_006513 [Phylliscum demangeonii]